MKMIQCAVCKSICEEGARICKYCGSVIQEHPDGIADIAFPIHESWPSLPEQDPKAKIDLSAYSLLPSGDLMPLNSVAGFSFASEELTEAPDTFQNGMIRGALQYPSDLLPPMPPPQSFSPPQPQSFSPPQPQSFSPPPPPEKEQRDDAALLPLFEAATLPGTHVSVPSAQGIPQLGMAPAVRGTPRMLNRPSLQAMRAAREHQRNRGEMHQHPSAHIPLRWPLPGDVRRRNRHTKRVVAGTIVSCVLLTTIIALLFLHSGSSGTNNAASPTTSAATPNPQQFHPVVMLNGSMIPGGSLNLHGSGFPAGGTVIFLVDGTLLASATSSPPGHVYVAQGRVVDRSNFFADMLQVAPTIVKPDGTFDKVFKIPAIWIPGSTHHIQAKVQSNQHETQVELGMIVQPAPTVGATPTSTPTTCIGVSIQDLHLTGVTGKSDPAAQTVTMNNCGQSGPWSASLVTNDGAKWLSASSTSGTLAAGSSQAFTISALNVETHLAAGTYMGHITFSLGYSTVTINISLAVADNLCILADKQSLTFNGVAGTSDPVAQNVQLTNCGDTGNWNTIAVTNDGFLWLNSNPTGGMLQGGEHQMVSITASNVGANLPPGSYHGTLTFSIGPKSVMVSITLNVAKGPCIQTNPQTLTFNATQQSPPAQAVTLTNCGMDGNWTATLGTNTSWLSLDVTSGTLHTTQTVNVSVTVGSLQANTYTGSITFKSGSSAAIVNVTLIVASAPCLQTDVQTLSFTSVAGTSNPASQSLNLTDCGQAGSWSVATATSKGSRWLTSNPTSGTLSTGMTQNIVVTVASVNGRLTAGTYSGSLTFTLGTAQVAVTINLVVVLPACLQITQVNGQAVTATQSTSLSFSGSPGATVSSQSITASDCGSDGNWTSSVSTQDGASWLTATGSGATSGSLTSGSTLDMAIGIASTAISSPGTYTGAVTLSIKTVSGSATVTIAVTYTVSQTACLQITQINGQAVSSSLTSTTLNYTPSLSSQSITINNCGGAGTVATSISYTTGTGWLSTDLTANASLAAAGSQLVTIGTTSGSLTGVLGATITFTITSGSSTSSVTVTVNLTI